MAFINFCSKILVFSSSDAVNNLESNGHVLNGNTENGVTALNNVAPVNLSKTDQDIVRLIGQYLKIVGLGFVHFRFPTLIWLFRCANKINKMMWICFLISRKTADHLVEESGCILEHNSATKFRTYVMCGDWIKADHYLQELQALIERKHNNIVVSCKKRSWHLKGDVVFFCGWLVASRIIHQHLG